MARRSVRHVFDTCSLAASDPRNGARFGPMPTKLRRLHRVRAPVCILATRLSNSAAQSVECIPTLLVPRLHAWRLGIELPERVLDSTARSIPAPRNSRTEGGAVAGDVVKAGLVLRLPPRHIAPGNMANTSGFRLWSARMPHPPSTAPPPSPPHPHPPAPAMLAGIGHQRAERQSFSLIWVSCS